MMRFWKRLKRCYKAETPARASIQDGNLYTDDGKPSADKTTTERRKKMRKVMVKDVKNYKVSLETVENCFPVFSSNKVLVAENLTRAEAKALRRHWDKKLADLYDKGILGGAVDVIVTVERLNPFRKNNEGSYGYWEDMTSEWNWKEMNPELVVRV